MQIELFTPYEKQKQFISRFADTDSLFGVVVAPRGSGKTLLGINLMLYWMLQNPNRKGGWVSPVYSQAKNVFDQITTAAKDVIESSNRMEMVMTFINGSSIKFLSGDSPDSIRGFRFNHLIVDEAAFIKELTIEQALLPTLNPNGKKCLFISTPKGKNHLFKWYNKEESVSMKFPLTECPYVSQELIDTAKQSLPPELFRQEFMAEFVDSSNDVFVGVDRVSFVGDYKQGGDVYVGVDTGLTDDMSVLTLINPIGRVVNIVAVNNLPVNEIASRFTNVLSKYNVIGGYIECNGIGKAMYDLMKPKHRKIREFFMTQDRKTDMVRKLISDIETATIELPSPDLCPQLHSEFSTYTYKLNTNGKLSFSHAPGTHDDYVDSLMLANYSRNQFVNRKPMTVGSISRTNIQPSWGSPR